MSTFDEQISQALTRAMASLHAQLEADFGALTKDFVATAEAGRRQAAAEAAETAATSERRQAEERMQHAKEEARAQLAQVHAALQMQIDETARTAQAQLEETRRTAQAEIDATRRETQAQIEESRRTAQAELEETRRAAAAEAMTLRKKTAALEADLDLARHQAQVELDRAHAEIEDLKHNAHTVAQDVVVAQIAEAQADADRRTDIEIQRVQTDSHQAELAAAARLVDGIRTIDNARSLGDVLTALAVAAGREVERAAVLIVKGDSLRGWRFSGFSHEMSHQPGAVMLARDAAGMAGVVAAKGVAETSTTDAALPPFARGAGSRHATALPIAVGGDVVAVLYADASRSDAPSSAARWPAVLEVLLRHASRTLEALTVQQAAGLAPPLPILPSSSRVPLPGPVEHGTGDGDAARRYARLLVSEIRMFHEPVVDAGRRSRDLRARLGGEIDRARRLYEQRVPADVRQTGDYFEQELVRTLADGDRTLLG